MRRQSSERAARSALLPTVLIVVEDDAHSIEARKGRTRVVHYARALTGLVQIRGSDHPTPKKAWLRAIVDSELHKCALRSTRGN